MTLTMPSNHAYYNTVVTSYYSLNHTSILLDGLHFCLLCALWRLHLNWDAVSALDIHRFPLMWLPVIRVSLIIICYPAMI